MKADQDPNKDWKEGEAKPIKHPVLSSDWQTYHIGRSVDRGDDWKMFDQLELHNSSGKGITFKAIFRNGKVEIEFMAVTD